MWFSESENGNEMDLCSIKGQQIKYSSDKHGDIIVVQKRDSP